MASSAGHQTTHWTNKARRLDENGSAAAPPPIRGRTKEKTSSSSKKRDRSQTAALSDGRPIDVVLSYRPLDASRKNRALYAKYRRKFENELRAQGLELEYESKDLSRDGKTAFLKIHAPFEVLARQAELRALRKPTHRCDPASFQRPSNACVRLFRRLFHDPFRLQNELEYPFGEYFTEPFRRKTRSRFIGLHEEGTFFTPAERAYLTWDAMMNVRVRVKRKRGVAGTPIDSSDARRPSALPRLTKEDESRKTDSATDTLLVTVDYLLEANIYEAAYALHDSDLSDEEQYAKYKKKPSRRWPLRVYLYESWVRPGQLLRHQPLDAIRDYYGEQVALYFAWLGFYTQMLIAPAVVGALVLLYGGATVGDDDFSKQACHNETLGDIFICRSCPSEGCDFSYLKSYCHMARVSEVFDNEVTVLFSLFTTVWTVFLLAFWKRYRAELATRWNITLPDGVDDAEGGDEHVRPQYEMTAPDVRRNPVTGKYEPHVSATARLKKLMASMVTVLLCLVVIAGFIISMLVYRVLGPYWCAELLGDNENVGDYSLIVSVTSSIANGIFIGIMSKIYQFLAIYLTRAENPRTDSAYERSYTYKVVIFECVNYYGTLFYLAFFQGQFPSAPHEQGLFEATCPVTGCLIDVVVRLAIIYSGKQIFDSVFEIAVPVARVCVRRCVNKLIRTKRKRKSVRWEEDYELPPTPPIWLFSDYLKLFIQYGFVTMFVPAFPLAPLFALLNNVFEIRLDAYKTLVLTRRRPPAPIRGAVLWEGLVKLTSRAAVLTNALLIALTTNFIPRIVYMVVYQRGWSEDGYLRHVLSEFNTSDWRDVNDSLAHWHGCNCTVEKCYYRDYRVSPWTSSPHGMPPYSLRQEWWRVLVARLVFILFFEHAIFLLQSLIEYFIPTVPTRIVTRRRREDHLRRETKQAAGDIQSTTA